MRISTETILSMLYPKRNDSNEQKACDVICSRKFHGKMLIYKMMQDAFAVCDDLYQ